MKRWCSLVLLLVLLAGCGNENVLMDRAVAVRQRLLDGNGCSFDVTVTADYGDSLQEFRLACQTDREGKLSFTVMSPESISGITGEIDGSEGKLTFDETAVAFDLMADGQVTPISAPWILVKTLRGGYMDSCGESGELLRLTIYDSYADDALRLEIWLNSDDAPVAAEILYQGRRILSLEVENFEYL